VSDERRHRRRFGQNFLVHEHAVRRIVAALDPVPGDAVLEIGPGRGALTGALIESAGRIAAVEVDPALAARLAERYPDEQLLLIREDVRKVNLAAIAARLSAERPQRLAVAGNLPYNISKPIALRLVEQRGAVDRAVLMFQREVAQRLVASPGTRAYGPLTVLAGLAYSIDSLFDLGPAAFRPRPRVSSSVTVWTRRESSPLDGIEEPLMRCLAASFGRRRQTLRNNLRAAVGETSRTEALLEAAELDGSLRAEALPPDAYVRLARAWKR
jgi:16S rRNA (adenine1518-N6/adenine1519-N6)-dimethyltransferase